MHPTPKAKSAITINLDDLYGDYDQTIATTIKEAIAAEVAKEIRKEVKAIVSDNKAAITAVANAYAMRMIDEAKKALDVT